MCWSLSGLKPNQVLCLLSQTIGELVTHSFLFPGQRNSLWIGSFLLALSRAGLRNETGQTKRSYSFTFCLIILRVFFSNVQQPQICRKHMQICFLMAESEEELKNPMMRVKEQSEKLA